MKVIFPMLVASLAPFRASFLMLPGCHVVLRRSGLEILSLSNVEIVSIIEIYSCIYENRAFGLLLTDEFIHLFESLVRRDSPE